MAGGVFNIGSGNSISIREVVDTIREIFPDMPEPQHGPARAGEVPHSRADISRAREKLGYTPSKTFKEALRELALGEGA